MPVEKSKLPGVNRRVGGVCEALKAYGVFRFPMDHSNSSVEWLSSFFIVGVLESVLKKDWALLRHYLEQAEQVRFDQEHGTGKNAEQATGSRRGR
jgi:hypothetical protein